MYNTHARCNSIDVLVCVCFVPLVPNPKSPVFCSHRTCGRWDDGNKVMTQPMKRRRHLHGMVDTTGGQFSIQTKVNAFPPLTPAFLILHPLDIANMHVSQYKLDITHSIDSINLLYNSPSIGIIYTLRFSTSCFWPFRSRPWLAVPYSPRVIEVVYGASIHSVHCIHYDDGSKTLVAHTRTVHAHECGKG
jgi:hypothetical protein